MSDTEETVEQVLAALDPEPVAERLGEWPLSRRQALAALASTGALASVGSASGQEAAGGVVADEAVFSNYGSESTAAGYDLTIDDETVSFQGEGQPVGLPDGADGSEIVLPDGATVGEVVGPDGSTVFGSAIPDSVVARYAADELSLSDGATVNTWGDASGNGYDLSSNGGPIYREDELNGLPTIELDGVGDNFEESSFTQQQPCAVCAVVATNSPSTAQYVSDGGGLRQIAAIVDNGNTESGPGAFAGSWLDGGSDPGTAYHVITWVFDDASSEVRIDGATEISGDAGTSQIDGGLVVGSAQQNASFLDGNIAEYLRIDDLTDVSGAESYLSDKWGITI